MRGGRGGSAWSLSLRNRCRCLRPRDSRDFTDFRAPDESGAEETRHRFDDASPLAPAEDFNVVVGRHTRPMRGRVGALQRCPFQPGRWSRGGGTADRRDERWFTRVANVRARSRSAGIRRSHHVTASVDCPLMPLHSPSETGNWRGFSRGVDVAHGRVSPAASRPKEDA